MTNSFFEPKKGEWNNFIEVYKNENGHFKNEVTPIEIPRNFVPSASANIAGNLDDKKLLQGDNHQIKQTGGFKSAR